MKINCLFPVFKENDAKSFFTKYTKSDFYLKNECTYFVYVQSNDEQNCKFLKTFSKKNKNFKLFITENDFNYNDVFLNALQDFNCDILLLGDLCVNNIDKLFYTLIKKNIEGANLVHIKKEKKGIKAKFFNFFSKIYNFFTSIFTSNKDALNIISLGLVDKNILDILKCLPQKSLLLKNSPSFYGFKVDYVIIDDEIQTYKNNDKKHFSTLKTSITFLSLFFAGIIGIILGNIFLDKGLIFFNVVMLLFCLTSLFTFILLLPKYFLDIRCKSKNIIKLATDNKKRR